MADKGQKVLLVFRLLDWLAAGISWFLFFVYRNFITTGYISWTEILQDKKLYIGLVVIPLAWVIFYSFFDKNTDLYRYSRISTFKRTMLLSFVGCLFLFITVMVDDISPPDNYLSYPLLFLFIVHTAVTSVFRIGFLTWTKLRLKKGLVFYDTILLGHLSEDTIFSTYLAKAKLSLGLSISGFFGGDIAEGNIIEGIPYLGDFDDLPSYLQNHHVDDVIIVSQEIGKDKLIELLDVLYAYRNTISVRVIADHYDNVLGKAKLTHMNHIGLIEIDQDMMLPHERLLKRIVDCIAAVLLIVLCIPIYIFVALRVRLSSPGPLLYSQERIGMGGIPFEIFKFRSMYVNAESEGPQLSSDHDPRITPWGRVMRKWRLDEIPQFFNLLIGDMSLVGPRPERRFFIDQIIARQPLYKRLLEVRPGITSWGQVKYGYASDVDQMIERTKYDFIYLENMSFVSDIKVLYHTFLILLQGKGK